jgi:hypothetical protein
VPDCKAVERIFHYQTLVDTIRSKEMPSLQQFLIVSIIPLAATCFWPFDLLQEEIYNTQNYKKYK